MTIKKVLAYCIALLIIGCDSKKEEEKLCVAFACDIASVRLKLKFVDINTNQDLLFSSNAPYHKSDLKVYNNLNNQELSFGIDSTDKSNRYIILSSTISQTFRVKLADKPQDLISVETKFINEGCCGNMQLKNLKLNQTTVCTSCSDIQPIVLLK